MSTVDYSAVDALVTRLVDHDIAASVNPAEVSPPGVWVRSSGIRFDLLGGYTHRLRLHLVVPDNGYIAARDALSDLLSDLVDAGVLPDEDTYEQPLILPSSSPKALPGLVVPLNLSATFTAQE